MTAPGYRRQAPRRDFDLETAAIGDLRDRMKRARRRALLPALVVGFVLGNGGVIAHLVGAWPILGRLEDGSYFVSNLSLVAALVLPAAPVLGAGWLVYVAVRSSERRAWEQDQLARGVTPELIAANRRRFG